MWVVAIQTTGSLESSPATLRVPMLKLGIEASELSPALSSLALSRRLVVGEVGEVGRPGACFEPSSPVAERWGATKQGAKRLPTQQLPHAK